MSESQQEKINTPKILFRILGFIKPFIRLLSLSIVLNFIFSIFAAIPIAIIKPIFQILFQTQPSKDTITVAQNAVNAVQTAVAKISISGAPADTVKDINFLENLKNSFYDFIWRLLNTEGDLLATLVNLSVFIIVVFLIKNFFKYLGSVANVKLQEGIVKSIRDKVFAKLTSLSFDYFTKNKEGTMVSVITNDVAVVNSTTIMAFTDMLREMTQVIIFLVLLLAISSYLTLIAFSTSIISLILLRVAMKYLRRYASRMQNAMADYTSALHETISGIRVVKAYNAEQNANKRFFTQTWKYVTSAVKHKKIITIIPAINELLAIVALCVVLFVGGSQVLSGDLKPDDLMLFLFALFSIMSPIATVFNQISQFQHGIVAAERVFSVLDQEPTVKNGNDKANTLSNSIEIKNLGFAYAEKPVLKNIDFKIEKNKKIAFVGSSGCGKSTMLDLLIRFYDPKSGEIKFDGKNIRDFDLASYRSLFGIVSQDTILFNDTIENNIIFGYDKASKEDIIQASKLSNAYSFISKLPNGFDTYVGDRGVMLSGGEKQRVAIARALLRNPEILIFDEATSALDAESEKVVQEAINQSLENRTAVLVAHRLATIINCDEILVFDEGEIVERGTHQQLLELNGVYRKLYDIQFAKSNNETSE